MFRDIRGDGIRIRYEIVDRFAGANPELNVSRGDFERRRVHEYRSLAQTLRFCSKRIQVRAGLFKCDQ